MGTFEHDKQNLHELNWYKMNEVSREELEVNAGYWNTMVKLYTQKEEIP